MKRFLCALLTTVAMLGVVPSFAQESDANESTTYRAALKKDRIGIDAGLVFPFGDIDKGLDLATSWGFNVNFWSFIGDRTIGTVTVGTNWFRLGSKVPTDSGTTVDLSDLSMTATPLLGGIGYVFGDGDLHPYVIVHGGATFVTVNIGTNRPSEQINNQAYFTLAGTAGLGYSVSGRITITGSTRYTKMFGEDLQTLSILFGASFLL